MDHDRKVVGSNLVYVILNESGVKGHSDLINLTSLGAFLDASNDFVN